MIMDSLEPIAFGEPNVNFHHLLNFDSFKAEMAGDDVSGSAFTGRPGPVPPALVVRAADSSASVSDSLNTPISTFMELPMFFGSSIVLPPPSMLNGKTRSLVFCLFTCVYALCSSNGVAHLRRKTLTDASLFVRDVTRPSIGQCLRAIFGFAAVSSLKNRA